jgi:hypothetical protein
VSWKKGKEMIGYYVQQDVKDWNTLSERFWDPIISFQKGNKSLNYF